MPRPRRARTIGVEDHLATRVRTELDHKGWSYAMLAQLMAQEGVDISPSSLQKSFTPDKDPDERRPIRVDELVAIARAFRTTVEKLLGPRNWVDQDQVDKALADMDRADRLLVEAVQTMLDAQIMLVQATAHGDTDVKQKTVGQNTTYWWATTSNLRLVPRAATKDSMPISPQAIGRRVAALKAVIHAIAVNWCQLEDLALPAWRLRALPTIGSDQWDTQLAAELTYYDEPEQDGLRL